MNLPVMIVDHEVKGNGEKSRAEIVSDSLIKYNSLIAYWTGNQEAWVNNQSSMNSLRASIQV